MAKINRKQFKNTYKIPRSLKESIKQNLNKIVKRRERQIRDEECKKISIDIETRLAEAHGHCNALDHLLQTYDMSPELAHAIERLLFSHWSNTNDAVERQRAAMEGKKTFARQVLSKGYLTHETKKDMILWKGEEQDEDVEADGGDKHEERGSGTHDEDDWSSTSTLA
ncbi:hypothetical protein KCU81_g9180, partial [Aureobasidium melanogenum]|uniref:Uncharacterized protein n=1 Tax=Aureobasidium melanogenum (strain CBS 110374) TaxID=1043003 RepID=A0A074WQH4_AURM1